jgi:hypothetical protein
MQFSPHRHWRSLALGVASVLVVGTAIAAKINLTGYLTEMSGTRKMVFKDGNRTSTCPKAPITMAMAFGAEKLWVGELDGDPIGGRWKQRGKGNREVKIVLNPPSLDVLNQYIDNEVSGCILSIPDGQWLKFKEVSFKGKVNKRRDQLLVKAAVRFRSREVGIFWDMKGDRKDVFTMRVKGDLIPPSPL